MEPKVIRIEIKFTRATLAILLGSVLLLGGLMFAGAVLAQNPGPEIVDADAATPRNALAVANDVAAAISYQGRLTDPGGNPLSGNYDMTFQLWDAASGGDTVGGAINKTGVSVDEGLFDVKLNVNQDDFYGQGLWLEVTVGGETLTPTQQLLPAPYALGLRPGAIISNTNSYVELNRYSFSSQPIPHSSTYGVYAKAEGAGLFDFHYGVYGSGSDYGVYGHSPDGTAVYGDGDVRQSLAGNGLVKAAVFTGCEDGSPSMNRFFNNVNAESITVTAGASNGQCTIDLNFDLHDHYWVASAASLNVFRLATCWWNSASSNDQLDCSCYTENGSGVDCSIMVLVY